MHETLKTKKVNRRTFLHVSAVAGGGLVIGLYAPKIAGQAGRGGAPAVSLDPNIYITVNPNNTFTVVAKNPETGQGIKTALPLNKAVEVSFTPKKAGKLTYGCAMGKMIGGVLTVQ